MSTIAKVSAATAARMAREARHQLRLRDWLDGGCRGRRPAPEREPKRRKRPSGWTALRVLRG